MRGQSKGEDQVSDASDRRATRSSTHSSAGSTSPSPRKKSGGPEAPGGPVAPKRSVSQNKIIGSILSPFVYNSKCKLIFWFRNLKLVQRSLNHRHRHQHRQGKVKLQRTARWAVNDINIETHHSRLCCCCSPFLFAWDLHVFCFVPEKRTIYEAFTSRFSDEEGFNKVKRNGK